MMFGVVLWSDGTDSKALIWCEDHGDLAYFNAGDDTDRVRPSLDPGDIVQFEMTEEPQMRRAWNPRIVAEEQYPTLAHRLQNAKPSEGSAQAGRSASAIIVPFDATRRRRGDRDCRMTAS